MGVIEPVLAQDADRHMRVEALMRFIDWAECESADIGAAEAATCLQLARLSIQRRLSAPGDPATATATD